MKGRERGRKGKDGREEGNGREEKGGKEDGLARNSLPNWLL